MFKVWGSRCRVVQASHGLGFNLNVTLIEPL